MQAARRSIVSFLFAATVVVSCSTPSIRATVAVQKGDADNNTSNYAGAIQHYQEYLKQAKLLGVYRNPAREAEVCRKIAHVYSTQGKFRQALTYLRKAILTDSLNQTGKLETIDNYRQTGMVYGYMGNYTRALSHLNYAVKLSEGLGISLKDDKQKSLADTYLASSQIHLAIGNYKEAERDATKALVLYERYVPGGQGSMDAQLVLGSLCRDRADYKNASLWFERSLNLARRNNLNESRQLQAMSDVHLLQGEMEKSIRLKLDALEAAKKTSIKPLIIVAAMRLGDAYQQLGDPVKANHYYSMAMQLQRETEGDTAIVVGQNGSFNWNSGTQSGSRIGAAIICLKVGNYYYGRAKLDSAELMFARAEGLFKSLDNKEGLAKAKIELAKVEIAVNGDPGKPEALLNEAQALTKQADLQWQIHYRKGILFERKGNADSAAGAYRRSIRIIESIRGNLNVDEFKTAFANSKVEVYDRLIALLTATPAGAKRQAAVVEAFRYNEQSRSRTFLDLMGNRKIDPKVNADTALLAQEQLLRLKISQLSSAISSAEATNEDNLSKQLADVQDVYRQTLEKIKLNSASYASVTQIDPPTLTTIQSKIGRSDALVEYWVSDDKLVIWVVTAGSVTAKTVSVKKEFLKRQVTGCRNAITLQAESQADKLLKDLFTTLIKPVTADLAGARNLIIVPHRSLHFLPFHALMNDNGQYLIDKYTIAYVPSASVYFYAQSRQQTTGNKFLGFALGDLSIGGYPGLPGTTQEVAQVSALFPDNAVGASDNLTESYIKENARGYNLIHIATHGVLNPYQPLYSYLLTRPGGQDDGRLTVNEIFGMDIHSRLVTLSACETGLGELSEGDDLVGLSRAFIYAGSPTVLVSLWKVDDAATAWLMTRFYKYITTGKDTREALALAQRDLLHRNYKPVGGEKALTKSQSDALSKTLAQATKPYYWAPFALIGSSGN